MQSVIKTDGDIFKNSDAILAFLQSARFRMLSCTCLIRSSSTSFTDLNKFSREPIQIQVKRQFSIRVADNAI
jgi:hypothetical protein